MNSWFKLDDKIRFLLVGGFNFCASYLIYVGFCFLLGEAKYQLSLILAWVISSFISFTTQKFLVFKGGNKWFNEYCKCCTTWVCSYFINAILLEVLVKYVHINIFLSQLIATFFAAISTYILFKKFAFKSITKS